MTKNKIKKSLSLIAVSAATALSLVGMSITPSTFVSAGQQLGQTDFENGVGLPWHVCESAPGKMEFEISGGVYKITIVNPGGASKGGEDRWDCQFRHRGLTIVSGNTYKVSFEITASNDCTYYTKIGDMAEPFAEDWHGEPDPSQHEAFWNVQQLQANQTKKVEGTFTANRTAEVEWAFHIGGDTVPEGTVFTFDNMSLECTTSDEYDYQPEEEWVRSDILTNQLGYFPQMNKKATLLSDSTSPVKFELKDSGGQTVYEGESEPKGLDADSIDNVHELDFSDYDQQGTYYIEAEDGAKSREFQIGNGEMYSYMLYDSLNYFYQNRSGIDIESQYIISGDSSSLARAAGHLFNCCNIGRMPCCSCQRSRFSEPSHIDFALSIVKYHHLQHICRDLRHHTSLRSRPEFRCCRNNPMSVQLLQHRTDALLLVPEKNCLRKMQTVILIFLMKQDMRWNGCSK